MVIFLTGLVSMILMRTLRNDYAKYAREDDNLETLVISYSTYNCFMCLLYIVCCLSERLSFSTNSDWIIRDHSPASILMHVLVLLPGKRCD